MGRLAVAEARSQVGPTGLPLRRPDSPYPTIQLDLHAIDPRAQYDLEVRTGMEKGRVQPVTGKDLIHYQVTIPDRPGSALVFYAQR